MTFTLMRDHLAVAKTYGEGIAWAHAVNKETYSNAPVIDFWDEVDQQEVVFIITGEKLTPDDEDFWIVIDAVENGYYDSDIWDED